MEQVRILEANGH